MGYIKIKGVVFNPQPISQKTLIVKHRLTADADVPLSYTTDSISVVAGIDGKFLEPFWILNLLNGTSYTVKIESTCGVYTFQKVFTTPCTCPEGFEPNDSSTLCMKEDTVAPVITRTNYCLAVSQNGAYGNRFARIYNQGFSNSSIAMIVAPPADVYAQMTLAPYWANPTLNPTLGVVNRHSVWVDSDCNGSKNALSNGERATISFTFEASVVRTVYVLVAADNQFELNVNGQQVAKTTVANSQENFKIAHIFPVQFVVGMNDINVIATGDGTVNDAVAVLVFDNTADQIKNATADGQLTILFKTSDLIGDHINIATCQAGYSLDVSGGVDNYVCRKITYAECEGLPDESLL